MSRATLESIAASLYDGGWRPEDRDRMMTEYNLSESETDEIIAEMQRYEED